VFVYTTADPTYDLPHSIRARQPLHYTIKASDYHFGTSKMFVDLLLRIVRVLIDRLLSSNSAIFLTTKVSFQTMHHVGK